MVKKLRKGQKKGIKRKPKGQAKGGFFSLPLMQRRTGMNRDIPLGGGGGSPNLIASLARQAPTPAPATAQVIQTPDQFNIQQDIKQIKAETAEIKTEQARAKRADAGLTRIENERRKEVEAEKRQEAKRAKFGEKVIPHRDDATSTQKQMATQQEETKAQTAPLQPQTEFPKSAGGEPKAKSIRKKLVIQSSSEGEGGDY